MTMSLLGKNSGSTLGQILDSNKQYTIHQRFPKYVPRNLRASMGHFQGFHNI